MKPARFKYHRAHNADEAVQLLRSHEGEARVLAGGQSLVPMMNFRIARPDILIDLAECADLTQLDINGDRLAIGSMVRQRRAENDSLVREYCPLLRDALLHAGPPTIRNRGTIGGNIANAFPTAHLPVVMVCLEAELTLRSTNGTRNESAADFFLGPFSTSAASDELLTQISIPCQSAHDRHFFIEGGKNHAGGSPSVLLAANQHQTENGRTFRVAISGIFGAPRRFSNLEAALCGPLTSDAIEAAWRQDIAELGESETDPDTHSFRLEAARHLVSCAIARLNLPMLKRKH